MSRESDNLYPVERNGSQLPGIYPDPNAELVLASGVTNYLNRIRPAWQAKNLIHRVHRLLVSDPSSACQRIFNASIHDLKEKIIIAGLDIAQEAAKTYKLPPINDEEDILENYNVSKLIELAYRMGLLSRPEYRRLCRVYDIRKDLEHEDDEYEATVADCIYIFQTCIDVVLANDPSKIIKLTEIKHIVEEPNAVTLDQAIIEDYEQAPYPRQTEIYQFLISTALNNEQPDIVRQNCFHALAVLSEYTDRNAILEASKTFMDRRLGRRRPTIAEMRVAHASKILPYLRKAHLLEFYQDYLRKMKNVGFGWRNNDKHGELLRDLKEVGGLYYCPEEIKHDLLEWLILCYIGEPGGYGFYGRNRKVFYSNTGAPLAYELIEADSTLSAEKMIEMKNKGLIKELVEDMYVSRRFEELIDIFR
jgi:hypothetical protein